MVEVYTKLPRGFYISTPMGKYNPDWAIAKGGKTKCHITTELKTHCKSLCVRAFGRFAR